MPGPLSLDLRLRAVAAYEAANLSIRAVAARFDIGSATLKRWLRRKRRTGGLDPGPFRGRKSAIADPELAELEAVVAERPDATRAELTRRFVERTGRSVSTSTIQRGLQRLGITRKKKTMHATERDSKRVREPYVLGESTLAKTFAGTGSRPKGGLVRRATYLAKQVELDPGRLVFLDEAGSNAAMTPRYARSVRGARAHGHQPSHWGDNLTMIGALRCTGLATLMTITGATTGAVFLAFVRKMPYVLGKSRTRQGFRRHWRAPWPVPWCAAAFSVRATW